MEEQALLNPETHQQLLSPSNASPSAERVKTFIDNYKTEQRFIEEPPSVANEIRDGIVDSVKLPRFAREEILNNQRQITAIELEKQH